jgi:basic membrane lipoprotein Med (substrate-binding protein (PBP1-ABC) superfamily)
VNSKVKMLTAYVGNWDDAAAGKEQAHALIAQGADLIFQNADAAGLGVFQAARETQAALVFGSNADQNSVAPDVILGSVVIDLPHAFLAVARKVREGNFKSGVFELGTASDVVRLSFNSALSDRIPPAVRRMADSVLAEFRAGRRRMP